MSNSVKALQRINGQEKLWNGLAVLLLFLVLFLPLLVLSAKIDWMASESSRKRSAGVQARLLEEMAKFKNDLQPEGFISLYVNEIVEETGVRKEFQELMSVAQPLIIKSRLDKIIKDLKDRMFHDEGHGSFPLFIIASDQNLSEFSWYFAEKFARPPYDSLTKARIIAAWCTKETPYIYNETKEYNFSLIVDPQRTRIIGERTFFNDSYKGIMGSYLCEEPPTGSVSKTFTDLDGFDTLYFYSVKISDEKAYPGNLVTGFLGSDLNSTAMLDVALRAASAEGVVRFTVAPDSSSLKTTRPELRSALPNAFQRRFAREFPEKMLPEIGIRLEDMAVDSIEKTAVFLKFAQRMLVLFFAIFMIKTFISGFYLPFSLRLKLMIILSIAIIIPAGLTVIVMRDIARFYQGSRIDLARAQLVSSLDLVELEYTDLINRQVLHNLHFKSLMTEAMHRQRFEEIAAASFSIFLGDNLRRTYIFDRAGNEINWILNYRKGNVDNLQKFNAVRILNNLAVLKGNRRIHELLQGLHYAGGFAEQIINFEAIKNDIANEAGNSMTMNKINPLARNHFMLFPDSQTSPIKPMATGFLTLSSEKLFAPLITSKETYPHRFFHRSTSESLTEISMALRDNERILDENWLNPSRSNSSRMNELQREALSQGSSGISLSEHDSDEVSAWKFYGVWPVILAGITRVKDNLFFRFYVETFPYALFFFVIFVLMFLEKMVSRVFMPPIDCLTQGLRFLRGGDEPSFGVEIKSGDEFESAGKAFNLMTLGLLHKKHISRFVSASLVKDIAVASATEASESRLATVISSDIRGFTSISEKFAAENVVSALNTYFTAMEEAITGEGGRIDRFIGDAVVSVFFHDELKDAAEKAVSAGIRMRQKLKDISEEVEERTGIAIENGVGIATAMVSTSHIGGVETRRDYLILGEAVDRAELLESYTRAGKHSKVFIDDETVRQTGNVFVVEKVADCPCSAFEVIHEGLE